MERGGERKHERGSTEEVQSGVAEGQAEICAEPGWAVALEKREMKGKRAAKHCLSFCRHQSQLGFCEERWGEKVQ